MSEIEPSRSLTVVMSGPSGVGKDTVIEALLRSGAGVRRYVTATTRPPRAGEIPGRDYHFVSEGEFDRLIAGDSLIEWAHVHSHRYGTPRRGVFPEPEPGADILLKIDVQGGVNVKRQMPETVMIFLAPPSWAVLEERLKGRHTESEESLRLRLRNARREMAQVVHYTYCVVNDVVEKAAARVQAILRAEKCRIRDANALLAAYGIADEPSR
ncbi:MAG: guanylate kinase [Armatimonadetes bacterium]|nr:guanylate kinase [Armatimonadota bacterium]